MLEDLLERDYSKRKYIHSLISSAQPLLIANNLALYTNIRRRKKKSCCILESENRTNSSKEKIFF